MNTIGYSGPTYLFIIPEEMYGEVGKLKASHLNTKNADIYFLSKMKKVKFDKLFYKVTNDALVEIKVLIANKDKGYKQEKVKIEIIDYFYLLPHIRNEFENKDAFFFYVLYNLFRPKNYFFNTILEILKKFYRKKLILKETVFNIMKYIYSSEVKVKFDSDYSILIEEPILKILTDEEKIKLLEETYPEEYERIINLNEEPFDKESLKKVDHSKLEEKYNSNSIVLSIDQVVNLLNIDVGEQEILYIGQTNREPFERLLTHEKLQQLTSSFLRNDNEAIVVHLLSFKTFYNLNINNKLNQKDKLTALEAELISYFKPDMNEIFKDGDRQKWAHIKNLKKLGIKQIFIELDIDGQYCKFITKNIRNDNPNKHIIQVQL